MLAALWPILAKLAFNALISLLQKSKVLNPVEAGLAKQEHAFIGTIEHLKIYSNPYSYPKGKNGQ